MRKILTMTAVGALTLAGPALASDLLSPLAPKFEAVSLAMDSIGGDEVTDDTAGDQADGATQTPRTVLDTAADVEKHDRRKLGRFWRKGAFWRSGTAAFTGVATAVVSTAVVIGTDDVGKSG